VDLVPPKAPSRRSRDSWADWLPGLGISAFAVVVMHGWLEAGDHLSGIVLAIGTAQLPIGRLRDRFRWRRSRTIP
jgi:hypothetical protein